MVDGTDKACIVGSWKNDRAAVCFRGRWFEVNLNIELEDAGLDPFYYTIVTDSNHIEDYERLRKTKPKANVEDLSIQYAFRNPKELLN